MNPDRKRIFFAGAGQQPRRPKIGHRGRKAVCREAQRLYLVRRGRQHEDLLSARRRAYGDGFVYQRHRKRIRDGGERARHRFRAVSVGVRLHHRAQLRQAFKRPRVVLYGFQIDFSDYFLHIPLYALIPLRREGNENFFRLRPCRYAVRKSPRLLLFVKHGEAIVVSVRHLPQIMSRVLPYPFAIRRKHETIVAPDRHSL